MTRPGVGVREAAPEDLPALMAMWEELRRVGSRMERVMPVPDEDGLLDRLAAVSADPDSRALVATVEGEVAGMTVLTVTAYAPLFDQRAVHTHYLHVRDGFRRQGVGKALLAAAVGCADEFAPYHEIRGYRLLALQAEPAAQRIPASSSWKISRSLSWPGNVT